MTWFQCSEGIGVFRTVADEDAEIVEKGCGEDYFIVVGEGGGTFAAMACVRA